MVTHTLKIVLQYIYMYMVTHTLIAVMYIHDTSSIILSTTLLLVKLYYRIIICSTGGLLGHSLNLSSGQMTK